MNRNGICMMVDILGFSNLIENLEETELDARILDWVDLVKELTNKYSITTFNLLSDTLFVHFPEPFELSIVIAFAKELIENGTKKAIPLRGAVTYGEILTGDFIYGKAVISAHKLELNQKWIGITFDKTIPNIDKYYGKDQLISYPVPMKKGFVEALPVLSWEVPSATELTICVTGPGLRDKENRLNQNVLEILTNTSIFKSQRKIKIAQQNDDFHIMGFPPSHFVEQMEDIVMKLYEQQNKK